MYKIKMLLSIVPFIMKLLLVNTSMTNIMARYVSDMKKECEAVGILLFSSLFSFTFIFQTVTPYHMLNIRLLIMARDIFASISEISNQLSCS